METVGSTALASNRAPLPTPTRPAKLRLGLFADDTRQPRWIAEAFARLALSDYAEVVLIAVDDAGQEQPIRLWRAYRWLDSLLFRRRTEKANLVDIAASVSHKRFMRLRQCDVRWLSQVAALQLDVAFALGRFDDYALQQVASYGSWRYFFGDDQQTLDTWAGFAETTGGHPVTTSGIKVRLGPGASQRIAYQSWSRTYPYSVARNRENLLRKTAEFASRAFRELHRGGQAWLENCPMAPRQRELPAPPAPVRIASGLSRVGRGILGRAFVRLATIEQWCIGYRFDAPECWQGELRKFTRLMPPADRFWADPFPIEREGRHFIFFEELLFATGKGHIAVIEVDREGRCSEPAPVLERDYHLSYPFLIAEGGQLFMIPETGQNRTVEIYRCVAFPHRWQLEKVLLRDLWCVDATFHRQDGKWWMFVTIGVEGTEIYDELHLYFADELLGEWRAHPGNPVKSDVRGARPAGGLYGTPRALYRPAQICAPLYGSGIALYRVLELNEERYREVEAERVTPANGSGILGIHTFNRNGSLSVIDTFVRSSRLRKRNSARSVGDALTPPLRRPQSRPDRLAAGS